MSEALKKAVRECVDSFRKIRWAWDGDGGAGRLIDALEEALETEEFKTSIGQDLANGEKPCSDPTVPEIIHLVLGGDLKEGDWVRLGERTRKITGFRDHPGMSNTAARIVEASDPHDREDNHSQTVFDDENFRILDGVYWSLHLWFDAKCDSSSASIA